MAAVNVLPVSATGVAKIAGCKNQTNLKTVATGIADAVKTYLDGTDGTHNRYQVEIKVTPMQV